MAPLPTRITAALANASERRSIAFEYQQTPIYHTPVTVEATLDEKGCLAVELPFTEAQMVSVDLDDAVKLFLEPGDQLHFDADLLDLPQSLRFSGQGAANNQFLAALRSRFPDYLRIDYKDLAVDAHRKIIDQRRSELECFLDEGCRQYQLTPGFIAYYRAAITYEWAEELFHYLIAYQMCNGRKRPVIPADYYDVLDPVELVDEAAIGIIDYRRFLWNNFIYIMEEAEERATREQLSEEERRDGIQPHTHRLPARLHCAVERGATPKRLSPIPHHHLPPSQTALARKSPVLLSRLGNHRRLPTGPFRPRRPTPSRLHPRQPLCRIH